MKTVFTALALALTSASAFAGVTQITMNGPKQSLEACQGTVNGFRNQSTGEVTIRFNGVKNCSNFKILDANFIDLNQPTIKLEITRDGARGGDFTVNPMLLNSGRNILVFRVKSDSGKTSEDILFSFKDSSAVSVPAPQPVPTGRRLICQANNGKFAIYNLERSKFLDKFYSKTGEQCDRTVRASRRYTCVSDNLGKAALYDVDADRFVDAYYSRTINECIQQLRSL